MRRLSKFARTEGRPIKSKCGAQCLLHGEAWNVVIAQLVEEASFVRAAKIWFFSPSLELLLLF